MLSSRFTITQRLRLLVFALVGLMAVIALSSVAALATARTDMQRLTTEVVPAIDANNVVFQALTAAEADLRSAADIHDRSLVLVPGQARSRARSAASLSSLAGHVSEDRRLSEDESLQDLAAAQQRAVDAWWSEVDAQMLRLGGGGTIDVEREQPLFDQVRARNSALGDRLLQDRARSRQGFQSTLLRDTVFVAVAAVVAVGAALLVGRRVSGSLTGPLVSLREVVGRQRAGDDDARADGDRGALEVRSLAVGINDLIEQNQKLHLEQAESLLMHQLTLDIGQAVRRAVTVEAALDVLCHMLGEGMGVDRVMANTVDADRSVLLGTQWHQSSLPTLPDIPTDLVPHVGRIADELWRSGSRLALHDFLTPEVQSQERARMFHRETGARAVILVPIGLAEQVIGMVYVLDVHAPRRWTKSEANAVQQSAAFVAQMIVESEHRAHLAEHVARLEQLDRQKTDFLSTVSHELRTPLTSISGYLELLLDEEAGPLAGPQRQMLGVVDRNTTRLRGLIDDLLVLNRIESGRMGSHTERLSVCELLTLTVEELRPMARAAGVDLELDPGPEAAIVLGDRNHVQRAMVNIISNGVKFTGSDGQVLVRCDVDQEGQRAVIVVQDTGIGIPEADRDHLFTRFYRASNASRAAIPGTGLGLAIVRQIVHDHHGQLRLESVEGKGTTVEIDLPLVPAE